MGKDLVIVVVSIIILSLQTVNDSMHSLPTQAFFFASAMQFFHV